MSPEIKMSLEILLCGAEPDQAIRVALRGAGIHLTFTSFTSALDMRRGVRPIRSVVGRWRDI
jgi:hypothetical protein